MQCSSNLDQNVFLAMASEKKFFYALNQRLALMKNVHKKSGSMQIWKRQQIGSIVMDKKESCLFRIHRPYFAFNAYQYDLPWQSMQAR